MFTIIQLVELSHRLQALAGEDMNLLWDHVRELSLQFNRDGGVFKRRTWLPVLDRQELGFGEFAPTGVVQPLAEFAFVNFGDVLALP